MLPLCFKKVAQLAVEAFLEIEDWHNVGVCLADKEIVHVERLRQASHGQILFQGPISPPSLCGPHRCGGQRFCCKPASAKVPTQWENAWQAAAHMKLRVLHYKQSQCRF